MSEILPKGKMYVSYQIVHSCSIACFPCHSTAFLYLFYELCISVYASVFYSFRCLFWHRSTAPDPLHGVT